MACSPARRCARGWAGGGQGMGRASTGRLCVRALARVSQAHRGAGRRVGAAPAARQRRARRAAAVGQQLCRSGGALALLALARVAHARPLPRVSGCAGAQRVCAAALPRGLQPPRATLVALHVCTRAISTCSPAQTACRRVTRRRRAHSGASAGAGPRAGSVQPATPCPLHAMSQTEANSRGRARLAPLQVLRRLQRGQPRGVAGLQRRAALLPLRSLPGRLQALPARRAQHESSVRRGRAACGAVPRTAAGPAARPSAAAARPGRRGAREGAQQRPRRRRRRSVPRR